jgi:hypothetical protein
VASVRVGDLTSGDGCFCGVGSVAGAGYGG